MVENSQHSHLERLLDDAQDCLNTGDVDRAITVLREAYKIDHRHPRVSCLLGFCALHKGKLDYAKKCFSFVVRMEPDNASARLGLKRLADHTAEPLAHPREAQVERPLPPPVPAMEQRKPGFAKRLQVYVPAIFISAIVGVGITWVCVLIFVNLLLPQSTISRYTGPHPHPDEVFVFFLLLISLCISIWFGIRRAQGSLVRQMETKAGKSTHSAGLVAKQPMYSQAITSKNPSIVTMIIAGILWLPSVALGAYLVGVIGYQIGGGPGAGLGGLMGIMGVQAIYMAIYPRRR